MTPDKEHLEDSPWIFLVKPHIRLFDSEDPRRMYLSCELTIFDHSGLKSSVDQIESLADWLERMQPPTPQMAQEVNNGFQEAVAQYLEVARDGLKIVTRLKKEEQHEANQDEADHFNSKLVAAKTRMDEVVKKFDDLSGQREPFENIINRRIGVIE